MVKVFAYAMVAALASAAPVWAQNAGEPGAIGSTGSLSGHNTPGSGVDSRPGYNGEGAYDERRPGMVEGRSAAPDSYSPDRRGSGDINEQERQGDRNGPDMGR